MDNITLEQHKAIKELKGKRIFLIDVDNNYIGQADYTRWNKVKWYQRILGNIFKRYKNKFVDVKGFDIKYK